jgi:pyruvate/2-oxoglutarate/acetoin dehydrogenase E1 component
MVQVALGAAKLLEEYDISAEVVDPRTLWPLDEEDADRIGEENFARDRGRRRL